MEEKKKIDSVLKATLISFVIGLFFVVISFALSAIAVASHGKTSNFLFMFQRIAVPFVFISFFISFVSGIIYSIKLKKWFFLSLVLFVGFFLFYFLFG